MRSAYIPLIFLLLSSTTVLGATLPLANGDYTSGSCVNGSSNILETIDIQTVTEGREKGHLFLYPAAEDQNGACITGKIDVVGHSFFGSSKCKDGGSRIRYSAGVYRFRFEVINSRTFISKGKKYSWCALHR